MKRVVITGLGAITPIGNSVSEFWKNILAGKSGAGPLTKIDPTKFKTKFACEVKDFQPELYFEKKELKKYDLFTQYAIASVDEAIKDAGLDFTTMSLEDRCEVGVIWASGNGGISTFEDQLDSFNKGDGTPAFNPYFIPKMIIDIAAGVISIRHKLHGPNYATVSACASSNTAIINAFDTIRLGKAKMVITGGSEGALTPASIGGFSSAQALSKRNDDAQTASRPWDKSRDGFVMGEGAGALILEDLDFALARGAKIYAEVAGTGAAGDAYHLTGTPPDGFGAVLGMKKALKEANATAEQVDYVNAHATSTPLGDMSEFQAIRTVFGDHKVPVSATKSMTGHLLGAAGAAESIISILSIRDNVVPGTINTTNPEEFPENGPYIVFGKPIEREVNYVMNNTFGFGGHVAAILFKRYTA